MFDLLIRGGTVIDGTGGERRKADLGIKNGRITEIGNFGGRTAAFEINALDRFVVPGFIDVTNHSDVTAALFQHPDLENLVRQGITTIIGGNCGTSLAPLVSPDVIHGIRKWTSTSAISVNWATVAELLSEIERVKPAINFGTLVGYGTIRRGVTNEEVRSLTLEEIAKAKSIIEDALSDGALGLSTNLGSAHEYHATTDELIEIARVLARRQAVYKTHLRDKGSSDNGNTPAIHD